MQTSIEITKSWLKYEIKRLSKLSFSHLNPTLKKRKNQLNELTRISEKYNP